MSLTRHLTDPASPVRRLFLQRYANTASLVSGEYASPGPTLQLDGEAVTLMQTTRFVRDTTPLVSPQHTDAYPWQLVGTAFDYRLRYLFAAPDPAGFTAARGAAMLERFHRSAKLPVSSLWIQLLEQLPATNPSPHGEHELDRLCVALAYLEQLYRSPRWARNPAAEPGMTLQELTARIDPRVPPDLAELATLFTTTRVDLLGARAVELNPSFAASKLLGGADADLVADGMLLEVKTVRKAALTRQLWWQLLGYLLADTDDARAISSVGVYFARHGILWAFTVPTFLHRLSDGHVRDLAAARAEFDTTLQAHRGRHDDGDLGRRRDSSRDASRARETGTSR